MTRQRIAALLKVYRDGLLNDTVPFWIKHGVDRQCGGFATYVDADGSRVSTDKSVWIQGRFTWLLSRLYNTECARQQEGLISARTQVEKRKEWLALAKHGVDFLLRHAFDSDGRCFYSVTRDGRPLRKRRYLFSETFVIIAFAEYARATGDESIRQRAVDLYRRLLMYYRTPGLLPPKVFPQTRQTKSHAMPMILLATTQSLRQVDDHPLYKEVVDQSIHEVLDHFLDRKRHVLLETVAPNGEKLDLPEGRLVNPGHAIETSWFLMEEARQRGDAKLLAEAAQILDWSLDIGWDRKYGGILYFVDVEGKPAEPYEHDMKLWWPHNEAIYATLLAHHLTGRAEYAAWHKRLHDWSYAHFPDRKHGEWFGYLHRDGSISSSMIKGNMWKGPFHLPRMQLNCWKLCEEMLRGVTVE